MVRDNATPPQLHHTNPINLGAITKIFPLARIQRILRDTGRQSQRIRQLPAQVMVYYVIALALFMHVAYGEVLRCLVEGLGWLGFPLQRIRATSRGAISRARARLGVEPLKQLYEETVQPIATPRTRGAWYRSWQLASVDGTTLDVADTPANAEAWGYPAASRGQSAFPQLRFVSLLESGTHVLFGAEYGPYSVGETTLAKKVLEHLTPGMLCLADRCFFGYELWNQAGGTGADLLWRVRKNIVLPVIRNFPDGSYLSKIYPSPKDRRNDRGAVVVRVIEYRIEGAKNPKRIYRLITSILDHEAAPAVELAMLYHERWEIEITLDEFKTHLRGNKIVLRSKTPLLVSQEFYGFLLAHFAVRGLMHEAALEADLDPDVLSFVHTLRVIRRKIPAFALIPPSGDRALSPTGLGRDP